VDLTELDKLMGAISSGSEEQLAQQLQNSDDHISQQRQQKRNQEAQWQGYEEELVDARNKHMELVKFHGELAGEAKVSHFHYPHLYGGN
jgi:uncharacterized protein (DUF2345 family)